jgi:hypothetical protein
MTEYRKTDPDNLPPAVKEYMRDKLFGDDFTKLPDFSELPREEKPLWWYTVGNTDNFLEDQSVPD